MSKNSESAIKEMMDMGFTRPQAISALDKFDGNKESALNYILSAALEDPVPQIEDEYCNSYLAYEEDLDLFNDIADVVPSTFSAFKNPSKQVKFDNYKPIALGFDSYASSNYDS